MQLAVRDELRSSRNGQRGSANVGRENCARLSNCPTQAKRRLEWATCPEFMLSLQKVATCRPGLRNLNEGTLIQSRRRTTRMHHVRQENLPFVGSSHEFIG